MSNKEQINTEYEATFDNVDILLIKKKMESLDGKVIKPNFIQKRIAFNFPKGHEIAGGFLRIRDEGDKITMTLKIMQANGTIEGQKEIELQVNNFENAVNFLTTLGAKQKAIQETKREVWEIGNVQVMLDERPFLEPFIELEGTSKEEVLDLARKLGLDWNDAIFDSVDYLYSKKYKISKEQINNNTPKIEEKISSIIDAIVNDRIPEQRQGKKIIEFGIGGGSQFKSLQKIVHEKIGNILLKV